MRQCCTNVPLHLRPRYGTLLYTSIDQGTDSRCESVVFCLAAHLSPRHPVPLIKHKLLVCAKAHQRVSSELVEGWIRGKSLFHVAERIPEGTKRRRGTISVEIADSDCGIGTRASTVSRGSNRVVANSNGHETRLDAD